MVLHAERLQCRVGCASCCVDDLTVFEIEADAIRDRHAAMLSTEAPHPEGACAFLDASLGCRVYGERPYVCRTQGLPLRWVEEEQVADGDSDVALVELRDICPLNEEGEPIESLPADACWELGPTEAELARLQMRGGHGSGRVRLRDLFSRR